MLMAVANDEEESAIMALYVRSAQRVTAASLDPVPVNVITGALGVGKTTAIAKLLASKPVDEYWVVILNEFTDVGVDALTLAAAARGAYDVRVIPGGCLCCTGELDFRRQLRAILQERRPQRILIEPSGIGHPGAVIEELRGQERVGALRLMSTVGLVDPKRLDAFESEGVERDQLTAADVLLLSKSDAASPEEQQMFEAKARAMFPPKRWIGLSEAGVLATTALSPPAAAYEFMAPVRPDLHATARDHVHDIHSRERVVQFGKHSATATEHTLLDRQACGWTIPREVTFNRVKLMEALQNNAAGLLPNIERLKAVLRTGIDHWALINVSPAGVSDAPCGWRQDSRIEVQGRQGEQIEWARWDEFWNSMVSRS
jgi:G3E family GTPase